MAASTWPELAGKELRYAGHTWELTGRVDVRGTGELLAVEVRQVDDVRHPTATLRFRLASAPASLNPGALGDHFDRLERDGGRHTLVVKHEPRVYRYELQGLTHR